MPSKHARSRTQFLHYISRSLLSFSYRSHFTGDSGEVTPVSGGSEIEFNTNDATAGSTADCDVTVTEDVESSLIFGDDDESGNQDPNQSTITKSMSISSVSTIGGAHGHDLVWNNNLPTRLTNTNGEFDVYTNVLYPERRLQHVENVDRKQNRLKLERSCDVDSQSFRGAYGKDMPIYSKNVSCFGSDKWCTSKEKFLENVSGDNYSKVGESVEKGSSPPRVSRGSVVIKEGYIEPPKINRISRSFHGKSGNGYSRDVSGIVTRRASDVPATNQNFRLDSRPRKTMGTRKNSNVEKTNVADVGQLTAHKFQRCTGSSISDDVESVIEHIASRNPRFTTTLVDEAEHAASVGIAPYNPPHGSE